MDGTENGMKETASEMPSLFRSCADSMVGETAIHQI